MISLSGLSATYPGYAAQEDQTAKTQINQTKQRDAAIKLLGANVAGAALAAGNGPQAPAPGQPSVPSSPPVPPAAIPPQGAPAVPQGGAPPLPPSQPPAQGSAPQAGGAPPPGNTPGKMGLQQAVAQILRATPGVANHPEILLSALNHINDIGMLDPEAQAKVEETNKLHTQARISTAQGHLKAVQGGAEPATPAAPAAPPMPTATNPQTGAKLQWDGKAWQPLTP